MKKFFSYIKSGYIAIVISLFALFCSCYNNVGSCFTGFIMSAFALLVTALIGWQIVQYIFAKNTIQEVVNKTANSIIIDFTHVTKALTIFSEAKEYNDRNLLMMSIDSCFSALQELLQCKEQSLSEFSVDKVLSFLLQRFESCKDNGGYRVLIGRKNFYLSLLHKSHKLESSKIFTILQEAEEKTPDCDHEVYALGIGKE